MAFSLERLSTLNAVSGCEDEARDYIIPLIKDKCDSIEIDSMGNVIAFKKGIKSDYRILVGTNIDEVGFIVSEITDGGFIKFKTVGEIDPRTLVSKRVKVGKERISGVIGMKAIHLQTKDEREAAVKTKDLYIDIGEKSKDDAISRVKPGDYIAFDTDFAELGDIVKGKALDRFGTAVLINSLSAVPMYDTFYVFSTQREIPCSVMGRGMRIASYRINPDFALIISTVNSNDGGDGKNAAARLGNGAVIEYMDKSSIANTSFCDGLLKLANDRNIRFQKKTSSIGLSVGGAVAIASYGAAIATASLPVRYSHTPVSYVNKDDIDALGELCRAFIKESDVVINGIIKKTDSD